MCKHPDCGPCFDLCGCGHCWAGWTNLSWLERLALRATYLWDKLRGRPW